MSNKLLLKGFRRFVNQVERKDGYRRSDAFAVGAVIFDNKGIVSNVFYPVINIHSNYSTAAVLAESIGHTSGTRSYRLEMKDIERVLWRFDCFEIDKDDGQCFQLPDYDKEIFENIEAILSIRNMCFPLPKNSFPVLSFIDIGEYDSGPETIVDGHFRKKVASQLSKERRESASIHYIQ